MKCFQYFLNDSFSFFIILAGLAETSECLAKSVDNVSENTSKIDIAFLLANTENQIEKYANQYKNLQPKEESLTFLPPNFELLQDIRNQGEIVINCRNNGNFQLNQHSNGSNQPSASLMVHRQPARVINSPNNGDQLVWDSTNEVTNTVGGNGTSLVTSAKTYASIVKPATAISGQCIPGSSLHVSVKPALAPRKFIIDSINTKNIFLLFYLSRIDILFRWSKRW